MPLLVDMTGRLCVVVGGGAIGGRRARTLADAGADVRVVDPSPSATVEDLARAGRARVERRPYSTGDLDGAVLVVVATGNPKVDAEVRHDARAAGVLSNVASDAEECEVVFPSVIRRGAVSVALTTGGASPAVASRLRDVVGDAVGPEWGELVALLGDLRPELRRRYPDSDERRRAVDRLMDSRVMELLAGDDRAGARALARETLEIGA